MEHVANQPEVVSGFSFVLFDISFLRFLFSVCKIIKTKVQQTLLIFHWLEGFSLIQQQSIQNGQQIPVMCEITNF